MSSNQLLKDLAPEKNVSEGSKEELDEEELHKIKRQEEIAALERPEWRKVKEIILETEENVLSYLNFHCRRYRDVKNGRFTDTQMHSARQGTDARSGPMSEGNDTLATYSQKTKPKPSPRNSQNNLGSSFGKGQDMLGDSRVALAKAINKKQEDTIPHGDSRRIMKSLKQNGSSKAFDVRRKSTDLCNIPSSRSKK